MRNNTTLKGKFYLLYKQIECRKGFLKGVFIAAFILSLLFSLLHPSIVKGGVALKKHKVARKETLYSISTKYHVSVSEILKANNLNLSSKIDTGLLLIIPSTQPSNVDRGNTIIYHTVAKKETLFKIATKYGTTPNNIIQLNKLTGNNLEVGVTLIVGYKNNQITQPLNEAVVLPQKDNTGDGNSVSNTATEVADKIVGLGEPDKGKNRQVEEKDPNGGRTHEVKTRAPQDDPRNKKGEYRNLGDYFKYSSLPLLILRIGAILFILAIVIIAVVILTMRTNKTIDDNKKQQFDKFFQDLVAQIIFTDKENETDEFEEEFTHEQAKLIEEFEREFLTIPFFRQVAIDRLIEVYKSLSGLAAKRVENLYYEFDLVNDTLRKIKSARWEEKVRGIREVEQMHLRQAYKQVYGLINHPNEMLRYEAQLAVLSLRRARHLSFLEKLDTPLSAWQHMNLVAKLKKIPNYDVRNLNKLLDSPNPSVNVFAIRMIQDFNMVKNVPEVQRMLDHPNEDVKVAAIKTLSYLHNDKSILKLLSAYPGESERVQSEILKYIGVTGSGEHGGMLRQLIGSSNTNISHAAQEALALMSYQPLDELNLLLDSKTTESTKALPESGNI
ncbi:MAG: LysM peptidoglycan-binding domain-containing protein [Bacteroidetes bacterium]|nr:LysM peptidoglycan-binding domain-containing protein [Bacteroidota bacterium]